MRNLMGILILSLVFVGCRDFRGLININTSFNVFDDKTEQNFVMPVGNHNTIFSIVSRDKIRLKSETLPTVTLDVGRDNLEQMKQPNFNLPAANIGQEFGLMGTNNTYYNNSPNYGDRERCTYLDRVQRCRRICSGNPPQCRRRCEWVTVQRQGWMNVQYYIRTATQNLNVSFYQELAELGTFSGQDITRNKIYTYRGMCRRY